MSRFVVIHHAHHADEKVFRLAYAEADEVMEWTEIENPDFDEREEAKLALVAPTEREAWEEEYGEPFEVDLHKTRRTIAVQQSVTRYFNYRDVVWHSEDPRWEGRDLEDIAAEQRAIVKEAITRRIAEEERGAARERAATTDLGGIGTEL